MKAASLIALGVFTFQIARGTLYLQDHFAYGAGNLGTVGSSGGWSSSNSGVTSSVNSLDGTALGLEASSGNKVTTTTSSASGTYNQFNSGILSGSAYYSFLLRVNSTAGLSETGQPVSGLLRNGSASSYYADAMLRMNGGNVEIGLSKLRAVTVWHGTPLAVGSTYLVVVKYEFFPSSNNDAVALWINPVTGTTEPAADISFSNGQDGNNSTGIGRCFIYGGQSADIDEIRIGSTWADVTLPAIVLPGVKLGFTTEPADELAGQAISPAVVVQVQNENGVAVASNGVPIILTLTSGSGTLSGTTTRDTDASGKATFNDLSIDTAGTGKQLTASASGIGAGLAAATSGAFVVTQPPVGTKLGFTTQPATTVAGQTISPAVVVRVQDENGVSVSSNGVPVTLVLTSGSGTLNGTTTRNTDANGRASFNDLSIDTAGTEKQFTASASGIGTGLAGATSAQFTITSSPQPPSNGPVIAQALMTDGGLVLRGSSGTPDGNYAVLSSTNVVQALNQWASLATNAFDGSGNFDCTNPVPPLDARRFFRLRDDGVPPSTNAPDFSQIGFANAGFNVTGGEGGPIVYVGSEEELQTYSDVNPPYVIYITNSFSLSGMSTHIRPNKTVIGVGNVVLSGGGLYLYRSTNVIIRNLTITKSSEDNIGIHYSGHIWIDHCTFLDATDGELDITQSSDYVTISWCKFHYTDNPPAGNHRFVSLIAANDGERGDYHVTYHHNWWSTNCVERMPSVRFGHVHCYNNYYNTPGNNYCVRTRIEAECYVENNFFENVQNPWERYITGASDIQGKLFATNNNVAFLESSSGVHWTGTTTNDDGTIREMIPGTDSIFTPPYDYTPDPAANIPSIVMQHAGAGKGPFAP